MNQITSENKPNCYVCKYRREILGDAHSSCRHPHIGKPNSMSELFSILGGGRSLPVGLLGEGASKLNIKGHSYGIRHGWFNWPFNFDPTWLESCNGFTKKDS